MKIQYEMPEYDYGDLLKTGKCHLIAVATDVGLSYPGGNMNCYSGLTREQITKAVRQANNLQRVMSLHPRAKVTLVPWEHVEDPKHREDLVKDVKKALEINEKKVRSPVVIIDFRGAADRNSRCSQAIEQAAGAVNASITKELHVLLVAR